MFGSLLTEATIVCRLDNGVAIVTHQLNIGEAFKVNLLVVEMKEYSPLLRPAEALQSVHFVLHYINTVAVHQTKQYSKSYTLRDMILSVTMRYSNWYDDLPTLC